MGGEVGAGLMGVGGEVGAGLMGVGGEVGAGLSHLALLLVFTDRGASHTVVTGPGIIQTFEKLQS